LEQRDDKSLAHVHNRSFSSIFLKPLRDTFRIRTSSPDKTLPSPYGAACRNDDHSGFDHSAFRLHPTPDSTSEESSDSGPLQSSNTQVDLRYLKYASREEFRRLKELAKCQANPVDILTISEVAKLDKVRFHLV
jgi:hypothetical protein